MKHILSGFFFNFLTYGLGLLMDDVAGDGNDVVVGDGNDVVVVDGFGVMDGIHLEEGDVVVVVVGDNGWG
jgi:hypothetical protein